MLEWDTTTRESEQDDDFRARTTTDGEFTVTYVDASTGEGADVFSDDGVVYITSTADHDDQPEQQRA